MTNSFSGSPLLVILLAAFATFLLWRLLAKPRTFFTTVYEWEWGLLYLNGRFIRELPPGRYLNVSLFERKDIMTSRRTEQFHQSAVVDVTSQDKLVYRLAAKATYQIVDAQTAFENKHIEAIGMAIHAALVKVASERSLEAFVSERAAADAAMLLAIASPVCGCIVKSVLINAVTLPPELRRLFVEIERAKLEGQAALERARGEHAALRSLANAAGLLKDNPDLMNLRLLQSVAAASGKGQLTLVVGQDGIAAGRANQTRS
ncbi:MAG: SPFH domain-containing protein [Pseudolabrys sp.]|nr:SPFH domain-containing protein [Pseudolabrys sp.]